ncbi:MAG TPA: AzlC family ABC transporter permease, partial [Acidimicrobiales bacterium]|nr:AzlC family ABC transporter permease [Acidimicrobiales bacterium]
MSRLTKSTVRDSLSVAVTVGTYGVAFGAAGVAAGFSVLQSCLFSLLTFTGASQFAAVGVVA